MSPPKSHVSKIARNTSVKITEEDREAQRLIAQARRVAGNDRTRGQDVFIDALYALLRIETGKTYDDVRNQLPPELRTPLPTPPDNLTQMPKSRKKR
jgi:hypothetical protein